MDIEARCWGCPSSASICQKGTPRRRLTSFGLPKKLFAFSKRLRAVPGHAQFWGSRQMKSKMPCPPGFTPVAKDDHMQRGFAPGAVDSRFRPPGMNIAAGEYGYNAWYFRRMLAAGAVDVLQADATRCGVSRAFCRRMRFARATRCPCRPIPPRPSMPTYVARRNE